MKCVECKWYQDGICYNCEGFDKPLYGVGIGVGIANKETNCPAFELSKEKDVYGCTNNRESQYCPDCGAKMN